MKKDILFTASVALLSQMTVEWDPTNKVNGPGNEIVDGKYNRIDG